MVVIDKATLNFEKVIKDYGPSRREKEKMLMDNMPRLFFPALAYSSPHSSPLFALGTSLSTKVSI